MKYTVEEIIYDSGLSLISREIWYKYKTEFEHREGNLPSRTVHYDNGSVKYEYSIDGFWHRTDGPAYIFIDNLGNRMKNACAYYLKHREIKVSSDEEFFKYQKLMAFG